MPERDFPTLKEASKIKAPQRKKMKGRVKYEKKPIYRSYQFVPDLLYPTAIQQPPAGAAQDTAPQAKQEILFPQQAQRITVLPQPQQALEINFEIQPQYNDLSQFLKSETNVPFFVIDLNKSIAKSDDGKNSIIIVTYGNENSEIEAAIFLRKVMSENNYVTSSDLLSELDSCTCAFIPHPPALFYSDKAFIDRTAKHEMGHSNQPKQLGEAEFDEVYKLNRSQVFLMDLHNILLTENSYLKDLLPDDEDLWKEYLRITCDNGIKYVRLTYKKQLEFRSDTKSRYGKFKELFKKMPEKISPLFKGIFEGMSRTLAEISELEEQHKIKSVEIFQNRKWVQLPSSQTTAVVLEYMLTFINDTIKSIRTNAKDEQNNEFVRQFIADFEKLNLS
ncbi:hypothetical protein CAFE_00060 [Caprobacter fermentans]|uniref:Uncharacterized protein n=1 Tax=Caproicibacter fermentans TaxID=2576756 RepID=A0A6N8HUP7_9FIRM|nr:hypothetical protein [Caproicibacter fermentans]MVB09358.1 hypothetical protein [Caproicibacter fermentans]